MSYSIQVITKDQQHTANWSGGSTTQIAIFPDSAEYSKRNFTWRLSAATVDVEESTFTSLHAISRILMVTEGEVRLEHQGHHSVYLKPFEQDAFSGDWTTKSFGKVSDLNLMLSEICNGKLTAITLAAKQSVTLPGLINVECSQAASIFYCVDGSLRFAIPTDNEYELAAGDALLVESQCHHAGFTVTVRNLHDKETHVIRADMQS